MFICKITGELLEVLGDAMIDNEQLEIAIAE
jgi:hypothetical protein